MITAIREVRRAKGMTLQDVADACVPPTTAQTIGRLEMGTRTVSVGWLNRIAAALGVEAADLVTLPERSDLPVAALLDDSGVTAPRRPAVAPPPHPPAGGIAIRVDGAVGDYRAGDTLWLERLAPDAFERARDRDVLVPRAAGRFAFGRLSAIDGTRLTIQPAAGGRAVTIEDAPWIALPVQLIRPF